jgi:hypothetical protein
VYSVFFANFLQISINIYFEVGVAIVVVVVVVVVVIVLLASVHSSLLLLTTNYILRHNLSSAGGCPSRGCVAHEPDPPRSYQVCPKFHQTFR